MKYLNLFITVCFIAVTALSITVLDPSGIAIAQEFTNQSFKGKYGLKATYGDEEGAGLGVMNFDGNGSASGTFKGNLPGLFMQANRNILKATVEGTYEVNGDGTIATAWTVTFENGLSFIENGDCVIMQSNDAKLGTEVFCMAEEPLTLLRGFKRGGTITMNLSRVAD